jgi:hypothetical protein
MTATTISATPAQQTLRSVPLVTMVVSLAFYIVPFIVLWWEYDITQGLGLLSGSGLKQLSNEQLAIPLLKIALFFVIGFNALRYFWSAFLVESSVEFHQVRANMNSVTRKLEWVLRLLCTAILFMIPATLTKRGYSFEFWIIALYSCLSVWDILMYFGAPYQPGPQSLFKQSVHSWTIIEGLGLLLSIAYTAIVKIIAPSNPVSFCIIIASLAVVFTFLGGWDIKKHWREYFAHPLLASICLGIIVSAPPIVLITA